MDLRNEAVKVETAGTTLTGSGMETENGAASEQREKK